MRELTRLGTVELAKLIKKKEISPLETVNAFINQIQLVNPKLNAVVAQRFKAARQEAVKLSKSQKNLPPLFGVPFTVKEMLSAEGLPNTVGILRWKNRIAETDCEAVKRLKQAGAILIGATNQSEFSFGMETINPVYGITRNPYDLARTTGGSSGGQAALIAAEGSPFGLGTELAGSIRMPAFYCGVYGHVPTHGDLPIEGIAPLSDRYPTTPGGFRNPYFSVGPLSRRAEDLRLLWDVLSKNKKPKTIPSWKEKKIYILTNPKINGAERTHSSISNCVKRAGDYFADQGARVEEFPEAFFFDAFEIWVNCLSDISKMKLSQFFGGEKSINALQELALCAIQKPRYSLPTILLCLAEQLGMFRAKSASAEQDLQKLKRKFQEKLGNGLLLLPTQPHSAPKHYRAFLRPENIGYTCLFNLFQCPVTSVPMGFDELGLPIGLQCVAQPGKDLLTIEAACLLETARG
jgi:fatty acid amide hydrolase 2